ncbi:hypothetical protein D1007_03559 [Hordeum vulgare]|nr:hypothetical protein D1007_42700 [Hordeum vulgare]KAE8818739.1 hypothetical protein D1007_03559 [Hordeum vulgare]
MDMEMVASPTGSWEGSVFTENHIGYLRRTCRILSTERVEARVWGDGHVTESCAGERVVFDTHFNVGFGQPTSRFLCQFMELYDLQIRHLGPNSVLYLAFFATLCEGYLDFWRLSSLFQLFFHFRAQKNDEVTYSFGGAMVYARQNILFPRMKLVESFKK